MSAFRDLDQEARRRYGSEYIRHLVKMSMFPEQRRAFADRSRRKAFLCSRRAGKSEALVRELIDRALETPGSKCVYVARTRQMAKDTIWEMLLGFLGFLLVQHDVKLAELRVVLSNGSSISLAGADSHEGAGAKLVGRGYKHITIDECQDWETDLYHFIVHDIWPALGDYNGSLTIAGTPANKRGFFWRVTGKPDEGLKPIERAVGWSVHRWTANDNPFPYPGWHQKEIDEELQLDPEAANTPGFRQRRYGEWRFDENFLVYPKWSVTHQLPVLDQGDSWTFVCGADTGSVDASTLVIIAYSQHQPKCFVVDCWKKSGGTMYEMANAYNDLKKKWNISRRIIDNQSKEFNETLSRYTGLYWEQCTKPDKARFMRLMSEDMARGNLVIMSDGTGPLRDELNALSWKKDEFGRPIDVPEDGDDHCLDALLYAWRNSYHQTSKSLIPFENRVPEHLRQQFNDPLLKKAIEKGDWSESKKQESDW